MKRSGSLPAPVDGQDPRPCLGPALERLLAALCAQLPELAHVEPRAVLVVSAQARGAARGSIRSLVDGAQPVRVLLGRRRILYELSLRPPWFRDSGVEDRLRTLVHELWHIGPRGDGDLHPARRHTAARRETQRRQVARWTRQALRALDPLLLAPLGHDGEVLIPCWLTRPVRTGEREPRTRFGPRDLFLQPVRMLTPAPRRTVWW